MTSTLTAVLLPGTGSDDHFVRAAFAEPLAALGVSLCAPPPRPGPNLVAGYLAALDEAAAQGPVLAGGVSLGAQVAASWAVRAPERCAGLLIALPAWNGAAAAAPAALAARASAALVGEVGLAEALRRSTAGIPDWLADELRRSWRWHGAGLTGSLVAAAETPAPTLDELRLLDLPVGVAGCTDDPVHPFAVAERWTAALPHAVLRRITLTTVGADNAALGRAAVLAWLRAGGRPNTAHPGSDPTGRSAVGTDVGRRVSFRQRRSSRPGRSWSGR